MRAHPLVQADAGKVALMRGPLVYCLESADKGDAVRRLSIDSGSTLASNYRSDLLKGVVILAGTARLTDAPVWNRSLYAATQDLPHGKTVPFTAIPYYANANRGPVNMAVWLLEATNNARNALVSNDV